MSAESGEDGGPYVSRRLMVPRTRFVRAPFFSPIRLQDRALILLAKKI